MQPTKQNQANEIAYPLNNNLQHTEMANNQLPLNDHSVNQQTYSNVTKNVYVNPKKGQGIILTAYPEIKLKDYIIAIGNIVEPKNILAASRMSNQRIGIYLTTKEAVDALLENHQNININNQDIRIRRLVAPSRKILLSNVSPCIPNSIIEYSLKNLGLKLSSPMYLIKAGFQEAEYTHIVSYRRFVYISMEADTTIPTSITVQHEEDTYRIFIQEDEIKCFLCKAVGHIVSKCPSVDKQSSSVLNSEDRVDMDVELQQNKRLRSLTNETSSTENQTLSTPPKRFHPTPVQLPLETNNLTELQGTIIPLKTPNINRQTLSTENNQRRKKKKPKHNPPQPKNLEEETNELKKQLEPLIKTITEDSNQYPFNFTHETLTDFLLEMKYASDPLATAQRYTTDIEDLIMTLLEIYPLITEQKLKYRFTRIKNILVDIADKMSESEQSEY